MKKKRQPDTFASREGKGAFIFRGNYGIPRQKGNKKKTQMEVFAEAGQGTRRGGETGMEKKTVGDSKLGRRRVRRSKL